MRLFHAFTLAAAGGDMKARVLLGTLAVVGATTTAAGAQTPDGAALYEERCAMCHTPPGVDRAPTLDGLRTRSSEAIVNALTDGLMQVEGADLTGAERAAVAAFITGGTTSADATDPGDGACTTTPPFSDPFGGPHWTGWGAGPDNLRYQTAEHAGLTVGQVPDLTLQ